ARADAELAVDLRKVPLHRFRADEKGVCNLAVAMPSGDQFRDPLLGRRKGAGSGSPTADPAELGASLLGPKRGAEPVEDGQSPRQGFPSGALFTGAALQGAQDEKAPTPLKRLLELLVELVRALELLVGGIEIAARGG